MKPSQEHSLTHPPQLIIFRAIAGLGNGGIKTNVQVIVSDVVSLKERGKVSKRSVLEGVSCCSCTPTVPGHLGCMHCHRQRNWTLARCKQLCLAFYSTSDGRRVYSARRLAGDGASGSISHSQASLSLSSNSSCRSRRSAATGRRRYGGWTISAASSSSSPLSASCSPSTGAATSSTGTARLCWHLWLLARCSSLHSSSLSSGTGWSSIRSYRVGVSDQYVVPL